MSMTSGTKQLLCAGAIGAAALGAGRESAAQPAPQDPRLAIVPMVPPVPMTPMVPMLPAVPPVPMVMHIGPMRIAPFGSESAEDRAEELYDEGREAIEEGRYDRAVDRFNRLIELKSSRTDAALYWKAYAQNKLGQRTEALTTLADLEKGFRDSRWIKDAKALEIDIRQSTGSPVSPDNQSDEELKMYALNALMQSDPERALPAIEKILSGASSIKLKEKALFVLTQSRSARAREILANIAKGGANPDLQLRAIRYVGVMGSADSRQLLDEAYRSSTDPAVKRAILRSFMTSGDRTRLLALAKSEKDASLRAEAVRQLGVMHADNELAELYQTETSVEVKKSILHGMFIGQSDKLIDLARNEKDPELRSVAIKNLGLMRRPGASEVLTGIYASDTSAEVRKAVVNALFLQQNAGALITLARNEKNPEMKAEIVKKLAVMPKSKEIIDYLAELLK
jgi:tetratricopeptide (TPR) repeat protein